MAMHYSEMAEAYGIKVLFCPREMCDDGRERPKTPEAVLLENKVVAYIWPMGDGKTRAAEYYLVVYPHFRVVIVVPRKALVKNALKRFNKDPDNPRFVDYEHATPEDFETKSIVICLPSLHKIQGEVDAIIIDESESVFSMLNAKAIMSSKQAQETYHQLKRYIREAKKTFILDANMGVTTFKLLDQADVSEQSILLTTSPKKRPWHRLPSETHHRELILRQVRDGKNIAIGVMSKFKAMSLKRFFESRIPNIDVVCVTGAHIEEKLMLETAPEKLFGCNVFIFTQAIDSGVDINIENHFYCMHMMLMNTGDGRTAIQMSGRVRYPLVNTVFYSGQGDNVFWLAEKGVIHDSE